MECEVKLHKKVIIITDLQKSLDMQESMVMSAIATATEDGRKKYPNEAARVGEMKSRLEVTPTYSSKKDELFDETKTRKNLEIELKYLNNRFSALRAVARMCEVSE